MIGIMRRAEDGAKGPGSAGLVRYFKDDHQFATGFATERLSTGRD